jgi:hypothetical protein
MPRYTPAARFTNCLRRIADHIATAEEYLSNAVEQDVERTGDLTYLANRIAAVQQLRRDLGNLEADLTLLAGRGVKDGLDRDGYLPDGRMWTLHRTADRKGWDHERWQHDARAAVVESLNLPAELVNPGTGDLVNVYDVLAAIEEVHGAGAPRTGVLKTLGLDPNDYCESRPGNWKLDVIAQDQGK